MIATNLRIVRATPAGEVAVSELAPSFAVFYEASVRRLYTALCLVTGDRHEAEEIAQEAFVRVFERWDRVRDFDDPTGYLFRVSMNVFPWPLPSGITRGSPNAVPRPEGERRPRRCRHP